MNRRYRPVLACGLALLLVGLLAVLITLPAGASAGLAGPRPAAPHAIIRVPVDYATIQEAINAAQDGDEIRIQGGPKREAPLSYMARLTITKGITLSGGWSEDFSVQDWSIHPTILDAESGGRAISITGSVSTTLVTIEHLIIINGDATGLGGWQAGETWAAPPVHDNPGVPATSTVSLASIAPAHVPTSVSERQARLVGLLSARGDLTGYPAMRAGSAQADVVDCGGAVYSTNARLHLTTNIIADSQASRTRGGYGGGVCIVAAPAGGVVVDGNTIQDNQGADRSAGLGGGLFIADAPDAVLTGNEIKRNIGSRGGRGAGGGVYVAADHAVLVTNNVNDNTASVGGEGSGGGLMLQVPAATVMSNSVVYNLASGGDTGSGGGLMMIGAHAAQVTGNRFGNNLASGAGRGIGGGLHIAESSGLRVERNTFTENTAGSAQVIQATGGGAYARDATDIVFVDNVFDRNLGSLYVSGLGGGLYLYHLSGAMVQNNRFTKNWGAVYALNGAGGGGLGLGEVDALTVSGNVFDGNVAALYTGGMASGHGGGIYAVVVQDSLIAANSFTGNVGSWTGTGKGGGLSTSPDTHDNNTERLIVADSTWLNNVGTTGTSSGAGGAIELRAVDSQVVRNRFEGNHNCSGNCDGKGGTMYVHGWLLCRDITVDSNVFLNDLDQPPAGRDDSILRVDYVDAYTITNNLLAGNTDVEIGVIALSVGTLLNPGAGSDSWVVNNTIVGAHASPGIAVMAGLEKDSLSVVNNILVNHTVGITVSDESTAQTLLRYNLFDGNGMNVGGEGVYTHTHAVTGAPAFRDPAADDYHLMVASAARDAGDPAGVPPAPDHDMDGTKRPFGARVDIGAYEWYGPVRYLPLVGHNACALPACVGWAVGSAVDGYGTILHTTDGGATWQRQGSPADVPNAGLNAVSAVDATNAWVVGAHGVILRTTDGGATWQRQPVPAGLEGVEFHGLKAVDGNTAFAVGAPDALVHATDGQTWQVTPRAADLHFTWPVNYADVDAIDATHAWAVGGTGAGGRGVAVIAVFDGMQWRRQAADLVPDEGSHVWIGVSALDRNTAWAVGGWQLPLAKTTDGGITWRTIGPQLSPDGDMNRVVAVTADIGWTAGDNGVAQRTLDGGQTWTHDPTGTGSYLYTVSAVSAEVAWVVGPRDRTGRPGWLLRTLNGHDWEAQLAPVMADLDGLSFVGARR